MLVPPGTTCLSQRLDAAAAAATEGHPRFGEAWRHSLVRPRARIEALSLAEAEVETSGSTPPSFALPVDRRAHQNSNKREILSRLTNRTFFQESFTRHFWRARWCGEWKTANIAAAH